MGGQVLFLLLSMKKSDDNWGRIQNQKLMQKYIYVILILLTIFGCKKDADPVETVYNFQITPKGEEEVVISWLEKELGRTVKFTIATNALFTINVIEKEIETLAESLTINGLSPLTNYFIKIEVLSNTQTIWSQVGAFTSSYTTEIVTYETSDGIMISCALNYISSRLSPSSRRIIFMHEYGASKSKWTRTAIMDSLVKDGNLCASFDFRGHGATGQLDDISILIQEPWLLIEDFKATILYLAHSNLESSKETVVFGASLGAAIATGVSSFDDVIGGVAASAPANLVASVLNGTIPKGMFYVAGENDVTTEYNFGLDAQSLYEITNAPKQVVVVAHSADHGTSLLESNAALRAQVIEWARGL